MPLSENRSSPLAAPGDNFTATLHSEPYPAIDSSKADLIGKNVFICGASKGIGQATALSYAKAGASSIAIGARSDLTSTENAMNEAAKAVGKSPPKVLPIKIKVTNKESVDSAVQQIEQSFGQLDILVHNSGVLGSPAPIADSDSDDWWHTWEVNVRGPHLITRAFLPLLLKAGDKQVVYVSSVGAWLHMPGLSAYQPSKLALARFTEFVDAEYGDKGVVSFCIHPGNVPTTITGPDGPGEELKHVFTETPDLCGETLVYLTSEKRAWLGGRYVSATWDMGQFVEKKGEIVKGDKLKARMSL